MRRSEFVTVPSFSAQPAAGSRTFACSVVSVGQQSADTTNGQASSAARTRPTRGMLAAGLVPMTQSALNAPVKDGVEEIDRLEAGPRRQAGRVPEPAHPVHIGRLGEAHVRG